MNVAYGDVTRGGAVLVASSVGGNALGWGSHESQLPPMLMMGDAISFRDGEHLARHLEEELRQGRLMAIDIAGVDLHPIRSLNHHPGEAALGSLNWYCEMGAGQQKN